MKRQLSWVNRILGALTIVAGIAALFISLQALSAPRLERLMLPSDSDETVAVFIVSSGCQACKIEPAASAVRTWLAHLNARSRRPRLVGVAIDDDARAGLRLLEDFGDFDELSAGSGYLNSMAFQYLWRDTIPFAAVPQLVVFSRQNHIAKDPFRVTYESGQMQRVVGLAAIAGWLKSEADNVR